MTEMSAIKSILLKGNLTAPLNYRLCPNTEFSSGAWNLSIAAISYSCEDANFKTICSLSCNFVRGQKYSASEGSTISYQMPLVLFSLESGVHTSTHGNKFKYGNRLLFIWAEFKQFMAISTF